MENEMAVYDNDVPAIADDSLMMIAQQAERRIDAVIKIKQMALKVTNASDWVDQNGKPYILVSGSEKVANLFNMSWRIEEPTVEEESDGNYTFTYRGTFSISGRSIGVEGSRSSKDPFFKKYEWNNGVKTEKPISAIDRRDVKMAAYTNLLGNGITRILGIRNLTYEDLAKFANITKEMITAIDYKKDGKNKPPISAPQKKSDAPSSDQPTISEAQKKRFYAIAKGTGYSDDEIKKKLLTLGIEHTADILKTQYDELCSWASAQAENREPGAEG